MENQTSENKTKKRRTVKKVKTEEANKPNVKELENLTETALEVSTTEVKVDEVTKHVEEKLQVETKQYVFQRFENVDINIGLTQEEAEQRILHHYNNVNEIKTTKTGWQIIRDNIFTFFNMLYIVITILLIITKSYKNLTFLVIVVANTALSIFQEFKTKKIIEKLNLISSPHAVVIRDGKKQEIDIKNVVIDDILRFTSGNQIITDCIVKDGFVEVNESMITGEADAISKKPGDMLYSGSFVVSGSCLSQVEHVGKDNYIEKLAIEAKKQKGNKSELLRTLNWIIRIIGFIIIPIFCILFYQGFSKADPSLSFYEKLCSSMASIAGSIIGMIPSGLYLLTTMALASGVYRLAKKHRTMVQQLYCIEMLARVDILCLDKTGTITDGSMRVIDCIEVKNNTDYTMREIVGSMLNCFEDTNATSEALIRFFDVNRVLTPIKILPFSSQRKYSAVAFENAGTFYLGAPEFVLPDGIEKLKHRIDRYASQGCRVLALAHTTSISKGDLLAKNLKPIGLIVIQDHIRDDAFETIEFFRNNGVDVKVISGDNPLTVSEIASRAGIANANRYVSLEGLTEEEVKEIAFDYTVFGRVTPPQKKALVEAYKEKKKTVAMTGDGVNDILALKEADCSIAMASGSEAARNVSNIVLMDSNFSALPSVVAEGRRVINNIQRTSTLFLVKTMFTIFLTIFCMCSNIEYFFEPSQLIIIEFFLIGLPSVFISLLPNKEKIQGRFIANVLKRAFPGALTVFLIDVALFIIASHLTSFGWMVDGQITDLFTTIILLATTAVCVIELYRMSQPFNWVKGLVFVCVTTIVFVSFFICIGEDSFVKTFLNGFLDYEWPEEESTILINSLALIIIVLVIDPIMALMEKLLGKISQIKL